MIFVKHSDIARYFLDIVIFYCAITTAFPIGKFRKGSIGWNELQNGSLLEKCWKTTGFGLTFRGYVYGL